MRLNHDILYMVALCLPDRSRLNLSLCDTSLFKLIYSGLLRENVYRELNGLLAGPHGALTYALSHDDTRLLGLILDLVDFKHYAEKAARGDPYLSRIIDSMLLKKLTLCVSSDSAGCLEMLTQLVPLTTLVINVLLMPTALGSNSTRVMSQFLDAYLGQGHPQEIFEDLLARASTAGMIKELVRLRPDLLPPSSSPNALIRHCGSLSTPAAMIDALIGSGCPVDSYHYWINCKSALETAAENLNISAMRRLLERGANVGGYHGSFSFLSSSPNRTEDDDHGAIDVDHAATFTLQCQRRMTPLHWLLNRQPTHRRRGRARCPWVRHLREPATASSLPASADPDAEREHETRPADGLFTAAECASCQADARRRGDSGRAAWLGQVQLYSARLLDSTLR